MAVGIVYHLEFDRFVFFQHDSEKGVGSAIIGCKINQFVDLSHNNLKTAYSLALFCFHIQIHNLLIIETIQNFISFAAIQPYIFDTFDASFVLNNKTFFTDMEVKRNAISAFMEKYYLHFNAATVVDAAKGYEAHLAEGGKMMITLAGAMSTAEMGKILAEMIRQDKVQIISCTGANLEEDIMNLVAHTHYKRVPNYRDLSPKEERELLDQGFNRVTDTCIPEEEAFRRIQKHIHKQWKAAEDAGERYFPHQYMYKMLLSGDLEQHYEIDPKNSWMLAAAEKNLPIVVPGWEDSTMGNIFTSYCIKGELKPSTMKSGVEYMAFLADWYIKNSGGKGVGFFQIAGGIAGDFPICVVPMLYQDLEMENIPFWSYFCQISDSTTSYGSYSGAIPNEKITWGKLDIDTPKFVIESDATIVAPLIFAWILGM